MEYKGRALTIAGSDSGGGAGIQADLKTFHSFDVFGMSAVTSITAQNTLGVHGVHDIPPEMVGAQIDAVMEDIGADGVKTGMLSSSGIIRAVAGRVEKFDIGNLVVDPVMTARGGDRLLREDAESALVGELLPLTFILTPNVHEAEIISGTSIESIDDARKAAGIIHAKGPRYVLLKGGHLQEREAVDILFDGESYDYFKAERFRSENTHGTGCTLSAAITACLARGLTVRRAVASAKDFVTRAIAGAPRGIGGGSGPLYHGIEPSGASAFEEEAEDFDFWFDRNMVIFESELEATRHLLGNPEKAVSIGVGSGLFAERLGIKFGVEPAGGMADLARKKGIEVKTGTAEEVPFPDGSFDTVLLGTVLSYVKDPQRAVEEAFRILRPGGHVVVSYLAREGSYAMMYDLARLRGGHDPDISPEHPYPVKFIEGARWVSTVEVRGYLENAGFEDLEYVQTLTRHPRYSNDEVEEPAKGCDRGDYIVVRGRKP